jgi:hypothetical protein
LSLYLQFDRFVEVRNGLESALTEMECAAADLRRVSREHGIRVARLDTWMAATFICL